MSMYNLSKIYKRNLDFFYNILCIKSPSTPPPPQKKITYTKPKNQLSVNWRNYNLLIN